MAGAVAIIEADFPQGRACEAVELGAGRAFGEDRGGDGDMALEHAGEAVLHLRPSASPTGITRVTSVVPSGILAARIDQIELPSSMGNRSIRRTL
jgi:hypothetical protein